MRDEIESRQCVTAMNMEELLSDLGKLPGEDGLGFFGPDSLSWRVNREIAVFLGAGRAALLQLAHPWVATSLAHHSNFRNDAIGRFHSTFRVIYTMLFGSRAQAIAASRQLHRRHTSVGGELPQAIGCRPRGEQYEANEVNALMWVNATLIESAILAYEFVLPPLTQCEREQYYAERRRMATLFGIPPAMLPQNWAAFSRYTTEMIESPLLGVGEYARAQGHAVLSGVGTKIHPPCWYQALTAFWIPPRLRTAFALPFGAPEEKTVNRVARWLPFLYPHIPRPLRFVGPFHEAQARLRGQSPGMFTRRNNRFWMGQPRLLYPEMLELVR